MTEEIKEETAQDAEQPVEEQKPVDQGDGGGNDEQPAAAEKTEE